MLYYTKKKVEVSPQNCPYRQVKSNSTDKMTAFLLNHNDEKKNSNRLLLSNYNKSLTIEGGSQDMTQKGPFAKTRNFLTTMTPQRNKLPSMEENSAKRCYFKNVYSDSHPMLTTDHKIMPKDLEADESNKNNRSLQRERKKILTEPSVNKNDVVVETSAIYQPEYFQGVESPSQRRREILDMKQYMERIKNAKRSKM